MRYVRIFLLYFQNVFELKGKVFVFFLISLVSPMMFLLFWVGARIVKNTSFNFATISSYYFLFITASAFLMCHMENDIGKIDIREGNLSKYLLRPFSFFWTRFLEELTYRVLQSSMGVGMLIVVVVVFGNIFTITQSPLALIFTVIASILALFLSYVYKIILGFVAFWVSDVTGIFQLSDMFLYIFAGYVVPIYVFPKSLEFISYILPFSYMIYFPVAMLQGKLDMLHSIFVISAQLIWLSLLLLLYRFTWKKGIQKYMNAGF